MITREGADFAQKMNVKGIYPSARGEHGDNKNMKQLYILPTLQPLHKNFANFGFSLKNKNKNKKDKFNDEELQYTNRVS